MNISPDSKCGFIDTPSERREINVINRILVYHPTEHLFIFTVNNKHNIYDFVNMIFYSNEILSSDIGNGSKNPNYITKYFLPFWLFQSFLNSIVTSLWMTVCYKTFITGMHNLQKKVFSTTIKAWHDPLCMAMTNLFYFADSRRSKIKKKRKREQQQQQ